MVGLVMYLLTLAAPCWDRQARAESPVRVYDAEGQANTLSREAIREIFFARRRVWPNGVLIRVFVLPDNHPLHARFAKDVLGVYPFQLRSAWDRLLYSGTGVPPTQVETPEEMRDRLQSTLGSIGYLGQ
jgi:hypothetical protein